MRATRSKKKKRVGPPKVTAKYRRGDLVSWQDEGKQITGLVLDGRGFNCPGYLDVRARGDVLGRLLPVSHATLRLRREQVQDFWFWL